MSVYLAARWLHIGLGTAGFVLGAIAVLAPKWGRAGTVHRYVGRVYAVCMLGMAALSVPLAVGLGSNILFVIGVLTFAAVAFGWRAIRLVARGGATVDRGRLLRRHVTLMGASYISAWTAFLLTNPILRIDPSVDRWVHMFGPAVIGGALISYTLRRRLPRPASPTL